MTAASIDTGGQSYDAIWLDARLQGSRKADLVIAQLDVPGLVEPPTFYVDSSMVQAHSSLEPGVETHGQLKAFLISRRDDGKLVVLVPGEPLSYGPRLVIPGSLAAA